MIAEANWYCSGSVTLGALVVRFAGFGIHATLRRRVRHTPDNW